MKNRSRPSTDVVHVAATDHRILRRPEAAEEAGKPLPPWQSGQRFIVNFFADLLDPGDPEPERDYAVALMSMAASEPLSERFTDWLAQEALPRLNPAVARAPSDIEAQAALGYALFLQRRRTDSMTVFETALGEAPRHELALSQAATVAEQIGQRGRALELWKRAVEVDPVEWRYHYQCARLSSLTGEWRNALEACREALRLSPFRIEVRVLEVRCLLAQGSKEEARAAFNTLVSLKPPNEDGLRRWFAEQAR